MSPIGAGMKRRGNTGHSGQSRAHYVLDGANSEGIRLLMISNQVAATGYAGFQMAFSDMVDSGELASFAYITPSVTIAIGGHQASLTELRELGATHRPDVILVVTPHRFLHEPGWVKSFLRACGSPHVVYYEADPWGGVSKPVKPPMSAWLAVADVVFSVAREPHLSIFKARGAGDIRFIPHTYCHVAFSEGEEPPSTDNRALSYDAVLIGSRLARWGRVSRLPGAVDRARLVRRLQRQHDFRLAIYGRGWTGRGAKGVLPFDEQVGALRQGLLSVNWDHFPTYEDYASDRLAISMVSGRVHVTTAHPGFDWLPKEDAGLFVEPSVTAIVARVEELLSLNVHDVLRLGHAAHRWALGRLSHREAARFMLGAVDERLLGMLPADPWRKFVNEWPR